MVPGLLLWENRRKLKVGDRDFYIDLLFYHTQMHCYVVVELKVVDFEPEFAGKLNFYIKAVDEQIKTDKDELTIGILLCKNKDKMIVEYALSDIHKPIGVSEYQLTHQLPTNSNLFYQVSKILKQSLLRTLCKRNIKSLACIY